MEKSVVTAEGIALSQPHLGFAFLHDSGCRRPNYRVLWLPKSLPNFSIPVSMAHSAKAIMLLIGKDEALLRTQALIFESAEYVVVQARGKEPALKLLKSWCFGIVVIDSTLPREERNLLAATVRSQTPDTRVVVFHASADAENVDLVMDSREGAASVLAKVNALFPKPPRAADGTDATISEAERKTGASKVIRGRGYKDE